MIIKCRMCGRDIELYGNRSWGKCEFCGGEMTFPTTSDPARLEALNRASELRRQNAFDKAIDAYDELLNEDEDDAEAHWGALLSWYGIEYVEDPATHAWIPTCHRAQLGSILDDPDYKAALENAPDGEARSLYEREAQKIAEIQKGILAISEKEPPYDVFICYKEQDENGEQTEDSVIAQDIYYQLTGQGFRVFFARFTLEDKLGQEYEPYIFAALRSARVMLVVGTKPERFNAVWVRNEWSRFLSLMKNDRTRLLIPCYRDMDPYKLPKELSPLQSQNMGKISFMSDVIHGVRKVLDASTPKVEAKPAGDAAPSVDPLLSRARLFLEDGDWSSADEYAEKALDLDPKCAAAYIIKVQAARKVRREAGLADCEAPLTAEQDYEKALRFADVEQRERYEGYQRAIDERHRQTHEARDYDIARSAEDRARDEVGYRAAAELYRKLPRGFRDADERAKRCDERADAVKAEIERLEAEQREREAKEQEKRDRQEARRREREAKKREEQERREVERLARQEVERRAKEEKKRRDAERREAREQQGEAAKSEDAPRSAVPRQKRERRGGSSVAVGWDFKRALRVMGISAAVVAAGVLLYMLVLKPYFAYDSAVKALDVGENSRAYLLFSRLGNYRDAADRSEQLRQSLTESLAQRRSELAAYAGKLAAGGNDTLGVKSDGRVLAAGNNQYGQCDVGDWQDIVAVTAGSSHTVGLRSDGTVLAVGHNENGECDVTDWTNIVAVSAGYDHTVGLKSNGRVVAVGDNDYGQCDVHGWTDIVAVAAGGRHTVGLRSDGTVFAVGLNNKGQCDVGDWTDIVAVAAGGLHTVGLKPDGTVLTVGLNDEDRGDVSGWTDIVAVAAGDYPTVGLKSDGTVLAVASDLIVQAGVPGWTDIVAVDAGFGHTVGLRSDGTVVATEQGPFGECNVSDWELLD